MKSESSSPAHKHATWVPRTSMPREAFYTSRVMGQWWDNLTTADLGAGFSQSGGSPQRITAPLSSWSTPSTQCPRAGEGATGHTGTAAGRGLAEWRTTSADLTLRLRTSPAWADAMPGLVTNMSASLLFIFSIQTPCLWETEEPLSVRNAQTAPPPSPTAKAAQKVHSLHSAAEGLHDTQRRQRCFECSGEILQVLDHAPS